MAKGTNLNSGRLTPRQVKPLIFAASLSPIAFMLWDPLTNPNAISFNAIVRSTGFWSLRFLCLTLAVTPLRWLTGWHSLIKFRRMLGLFSFFYAAVHTIVYVAFGPAATAHMLQGIGKDLLRPFFFIGLAALALMVPLAATSTAGMIRRLGGSCWQALHRLAYPAAIASVLHTYWPLTGARHAPRYALILSIIFVLRLGKRKTRNGTYTKFRTHPREMFLP